MDKHLGVDLLEALRHHSGTVIGGDRIGEVYIEHRGLMAWATDEIAALRAEVAWYRAERADVAKMSRYDLILWQARIRAALTQHDSAQDGQEGGNA